MVTWVMILVFLLLCSSILPFGHSGLPVAFSFSLQVAAPKERRFHTDLSANKNNIETGDITIQRGCQFYSIHYDIVRPSDSEKPTVVVLHGGPGVPSNYLLEPLVQHASSRPLLFWDQLGCGQSDRPDFDESLYSIDKFVTDLTQLLEELAIDNFHLYGQSFGGILAFEYLKRERPDNCLSVILSSTPTNDECGNSKNGAAPRRVA